MWALFRSGSLWIALAALVMLAACAKGHTEDPADGGVEGATLDIGGELGDQGRDLEADLRGDSGADRGLDGPGIDVVDIGGDLEADLGGDLEADLGVDLASDQGSDIPSCGGQPCDDGLDCTDDICGRGGSCTHPLKGGYCLIDGQCYGDGDKRAPSGGCHKCDADHPEDWTVDTGLCDAGGAACLTPTCDAGGACGLQLDPDTCYVDDLCIADGAEHPQNPCLVCDSSVATDQLQHASPSKPCDDDGHDCTADHCQAGGCVHELVADSCLIGDVCYPAGDRPGHECQHCHPPTSTDSWTDKPDRITSCTDEGLGCTDDVCDGGSCTHDLRGDSCLIGGVCHAADDPHPTQDCRSCRPLLDQHVWSIAAAGTACTTDLLTCTEDKCDGGGGCTHPLKDDNCLIGGTCYAADEVVGNQGCSRCIPAVSTSAATHAEGAPCDDGEGDTALDSCIEGSCRGFVAFNWEWLASDKSTALTGVAAIAGGGNWVTGRYTDDGDVEHGLIAQLAGTATPVPVATSAQPLTAIHHRLAVGDAGMAAYFDGSDWVAATDVVDHFGAADLDAVWGAQLGAGQTFFAGGSGGALSRCVTADNGVSFSCQDLGLLSTIDVRRVFGTVQGGAQGPLWALRGSHWEDIYHSSDGSSWSTAAPEGCFDSASSPCHDANDGRFADLWARNAGDVWAVGGAGLIVRYDGSAWHKVTIPDLPGEAPQEAYNFRGVYVAPTLVVLVADRTWDGLYHDMVLLFYNPTLDRFWPARLAFDTTVGDPHRDSYRFHDVAGFNLSSLYVVGSIWTGDEQRGLFMTLP